MTPAQQIARLDASLAKAGSPVTVRRYTALTGTPRPKIDVTVNASARPAKAEELIGSIDQQQWTVVLSPTGLGSLLPLKKGDKIVMPSGEKNIERPGDIHVQGTLVSMNLLATG